MRSPLTYASAVQLLCVALLVQPLAGCLGQNGITPPLDRMFLPSGMTADPEGGLLYVINSNGDLRFNAGTVVAVDVAAAAADRAAIWPPCAVSRFETGQNPDSSQRCCIDAQDRNILNCSDSAYIQTGATAQIGSFGGATALQTYQRGPDLVRRLFVAVRAEPSITFVDITVNQGQASTRCTGPRGDLSPQLPNPFCDSNWKISRPNGAAVGDDVLAEEPHSLVLDQTLGILYVAHLAITVNNTVVGGGVSTIDVCAPGSPESPRFGSLNATVFPSLTIQGVTALTISRPGDPSAPIFAVSRNSAFINGLLPQDPAQAASCDNSAVGVPLPQRNLGLVPGEEFQSSAFLPRGTDLRGFLPSPDGTRGYVLHRNTPEATIAADPSAIVILDRRPNASGQPANTPGATIGTCNGPQALQQHDAGRGTMLFVTCFEGGQIYVVDPSLPALAGPPINVGHGPTVLVFSPTDPTVAYVANYADNDLVVIDLAPGSPTEFGVVQRIGFPHALTQ